MNSEGIAYEELNGLLQLIRGSIETAQEVAQLVDNRGLDSRLEAMRGLAVVAQADVCPFLDTEEFEAVWDE